METTMRSKGSAYYLAAAIALAAMPASKVSAQDINTLQFPLNADRIRAIAPGAYKTCAAEAAAYKRDQYLGDGWFVDAFAGPLGNEHNIRAEFEFVRPLIASGTSDPRYLFSWCRLKYLIENYR
jgi:hypothetical protein